MPAHVEAAVPGTLNFQARLLTGAGAIVPDGTYNAEFKLYNVATGGSALWTETRLTTDAASLRIDVRSGYLSVALGDKTAFGAINWDQQLWLTMNIGGTGGTPSWDGEMTPRLRLTSVPYAQQAARAAVLQQTTAGTGIGTLDFSSLSVDRKYLLPDTTLATTASPGTICVYNGASSNCPAATGSAFYIQNTAGSATPQTAANFNIQTTNSTTNGTIGGIIRGAAGGQTVDLFQLQSTAGSVLSKFDANGNLSVGTSTSPTGGVATFNGNVGIGTTGPGVPLDVNGNIRGRVGISIGSTFVTPADGQLRLGGGSPSIYFDRAGSQEWLLYQASGVSDLFIRDITNARMHVTYTPGATTSIAKTQFGSQVIVDDKLGIGTSAFGTNNRLLVNPYGTVDNLATAQITTTAAANKGLVIQGAASQTANLLEVQNSSGTVVSSLDKEGRLGLGINNTNGYILDIKSTTTNRIAAIETPNSRTIITDSGGVNGFSVKANAGFGWEPRFNSGQTAFSFDISPAYGNISFNRDNGSTSLITRMAYVNKALEIFSLSPSAVTTTIQASASQTADLLQLQNSAGTVQSKFDATGNLSVGTSTSPTGGVATFNGNVGIGTANPGANLEIAGNGTIRIGSGNQLTLSSGGASSSIRNLNTTSGAAHLSIGAGAGASQIRFNDISGDGTAGALFYSGGVSPSLVATLNGSGRLYLGGATSPTNILDVNGAAAFGAYAGTAAPSNGIIVSGNVGIGTTTPSSILSLGGNVVRTIQTERHTTANTAGNDLTLKVGGATSGATDKNGGDLYLTSGIATGTGSSNLYFQTATSGTTGTADNAPSTKLTVLGSGSVGIGTTAPAALLSVGSTSQFQVSSAGAVTAVGLNSGTGLIQGTGGLTITGTSSLAAINVSGAYIQSGTGANTFTGTTTLSAAGTGLSVSNDATVGGTLAVTGAVTGGTYNGQTISSAASFTGTVAIAGSNALTLGTTGTSTGAIVLKGATAASGSLTLAGPANPSTANYTVSLPVVSANDTICLAGLNNCTAVGTAGGDLAGSYPNPTIAKLQGSTLSISSPVTGQVLNYNGTAWVNTSSPTLAGTLTVQGSGNSSFVGNVGIGTTSPSSILSLGGNVARTIQTERHTTANTAGNDLTLKVGGATSGATNKNGGNLYLASGTATGTGVSNIYFQTASPGASGTADRAPTTKLIIQGNGDVGIGTTTPNTKLEVNGALRLSGTATDVFTTPGSGVGVNTKINIPFYTLGDFDQVLSIGIGGLSQSTARVVSIFDDRGVAHQPSIGVFSPTNEADLFGLSWDGSTTTAYLKTVGSNIGIRSNTTDIATFLSNGRVGIGTTAPTSVLHVVGSQPLTVAANGTAATQALQVTGAKGGNTTGTTGQVGGIGAAVNVTAGAGGDAPGGSTNGSGGSITLQGGAPGSGAGAAGSFGNILLQTSGGNVGIGTSTPSYDLSFGGESARTIQMQVRTGNAAGNSLTLKAGGAGAGASAFAGGQLILQGGSAAGTGNANGGAVTIAGGAGVGTGTQGLVNLSTTAFTSASVQTFASSGSITAGNIDLYSTLPVTASGVGVVVTVPDPNQSVMGRIVYVSARSGSNDFTLRFNSLRTPIDIAMKANSTATLIWNGTDWTAAGASSSTDLQSAYNNTLTSAGGAELVLNASGGAADGLTIRNNATTPISGGILEIQSSIGTNLFSVNNFGTELAANGGSETSSTFATDWTAAPAGGAVTRTTTAGQFVTGLAGAQVVTTTTANTGIRNNLSGNPVNTIGAVYQVSFTAKSSLNGTAIDVQYSRNGGTNLIACTNYGAAGAQTLSNTVWTKITCTITIDSVTAATDPDLYIRKTDAVTAPTIYIDNLSFIRNDTTTQPSNVQVGGGINGGPVTLFTLDRSSAPPVANGNTTYYGSMYYDTTTGRIQCYESDGWGACGSAPDNIITLTPEYTGAVLNGNGIGTMTADFCGNGGGLSVNTAFCASGEARSYYRWTSPQTSDQTYSIFVNYKLPSTFKEFIDDNTIKLTAYKDDATNAGATLEVYRKNVASGTITQCGSTTTVTTSTGTWNTTSLGGSGEQSSCGFAAGDYAIYKITVTAKNAANVYIENLDFTYTNK